MPDQPQDLFPDGGAPPQPQPQPQPPAPAAEPPAPVAGEPAQQDLGTFKSPEELLRAYKEVQAAKTRAEQERAQYKTDLETAIEHNRGWQAMFEQQQHAAAQQPVAQEPEPLDITEEAFYQDPIQSATTIARREYEQREQGLLQRIQVLESGLGRTGLQQMESAFVTNNPVYGDPEVVAVARALMARSDPNVAAANPGAVVEFSYNTAFGQIAARRAAAQPLQFQPSPQPVAQRIPQAPTTMQIGGQAGGGGGPQEPLDPMVERMIAQGRVTRDSVLQRTQKLRETRDGTQ